MYLCYSIMLTISLLTAVQCTVYSMYSIYLCYSIMHTIWRLCIRGGRTKHLPKKNENIFQI